MSLAQQIEPTGHHDDTNLVRHGYEPVDSEREDAIMARYAWDEGNYSQHRYEQRERWHRDVPCQEGDDGENQQCSEKRI